MGDEPSTVDEKTVDEIEAELQRERQLEANLQMDMYLAVQEQYSEEEHRMNEDDDAVSSPSMDRRDDSAWGGGRSICSSRSSNTANWIESCMEMAGDKMRHEELELESDLALEQNILQEDLQMAADQAAEQYAEEEDIVEAHSGAKACRLEEAARQALDMGMVATARFLSKRKQCCGGVGPQRTDGAGAASSTAGIGRENVRIITMLTLTATAADARQTVQDETYDEGSAGSFLSFVVLIGIIGVVFGMAVQKGARAMAAATQTRATQTDPTTEPMRTMIPKMKTMIPKVFTMIQCSSVVHTRTCKAVRETTSQQQTRTLCQYCEKIMDRGD